MDPFSRHNRETLAKEDTVDGPVGPCRIVGQMKI